jgi:hypothetical protein
MHRLFRRAIGASGGWPEPAGQSVRTFEILDRTASQENHSPAKAG